MKKYFVILTITTIILLHPLQTLEAQTQPTQGEQQCQPIYGGGETCQQEGPISINKTVRNPETKEYVNNLGISDSKYMPNQNIPFQITVKNTSNKAVSNIAIKDILPPLVNFDSADGKFDPKTRTVTMNINQLKANESKTLNIQGKVASRDKFPTDQGIICEVNQAIANQNNKINQDNSQFCIQKDPLLISPPFYTLPSISPNQPFTPPNNNQPNPPNTKGGLPVYPPGATKTTPPTGPEALAVFALLPAGGLGLFLRKKAK